MFAYAFHAKAEKELAHLPLQEHQRIIEKIKQLCILRHPLVSGHVRKLSGYSEPTYRLRVGNYRVKFSIRQPRTLFITQVQHRQAGY